jgi:hypothetical protein
MNDEVDHANAASSERAERVEGIVGDDFASSGLG